jgi:hypothetical protein
VQLPVMTVEKFGEGKAVTGNVCRQQCGIAALLRRFLPNPLREAHGRTVTNRPKPGTSLGPAGQDLACTVTSERLVRLCPLVVPSVGIHTST